MNIEHINFVVFDKPYCQWGIKLMDSNKKFIEGIDPYYFHYIVDQNLGLLDSDNKHYAALSIRMGYCHALESFFALLGAFLQAPLSVAGWLNNYRTKHLRKFARDLLYGFKGMKNFHSLGEVSLDFLAKIINQYIPVDDNQKDKFLEKFGLLWKRFAREFFNDKIISEFNSIKHGLRIHPGGVFLAFGLQDNPDAPAPKEKMQGLGGSVFGSTYNQKIPVGKGKLSHINIELREYTNNWDPNELALRVDLLAVSMNNVLSAIKIVNGEKPNNLKFGFPESIEKFEEAWAGNMGALGAGFHYEFDHNTIKPFTEEEILSAYMKNE